ncbi:MAG: hypothetical protein ACI4IF_01125 [Acutalibacteraceae bacterium]
MIILRFVNSMKPKSNKRKRIKERIERESFIINRKIFNIYTIPKSNENDRNIQHLISSNKGNVIILNKEDFVPKEFLYSPNQYFQRAVVSTLTKIIKLNKAEYKSVCLKVNDFKITNELYELAETAKKLVITTEKSKNIELFTEKCFVNYGLVVTRSDSIDYNCNVIIDLDKIDDSAKLIGDFNGLSKLIYPNNEYFKVNENVERILDLGISLPLACSLIYGDSLPFK